MDSTANVDDGLNRAPQWYEVHSPVGSDGDVPRNAIALVYSTSATQEFRRGEFLELTSDPLTLGRFDQLVSAWGALNLNAKVLHFVTQPDIDITPLFAETWETWISSWFQIKIAVEIWKNGVTKSRSQESRYDWLEHNLRPTESTRSDITFAAEALYHPLIDWDFFRYLEKMFSDREGNSPDDFFFNHQWLWRSELQKSFEMRVSRQAPDGSERSEDECRRAAALGMLVLAFKLNLAGRASPVAVIHTNNDKLVRAERAITRFGQTWVDFYQVVLGNEEYGTCTECGHIFFCNGRAKNKNKRYCSGKCRTRHCRKNAH